MIKKGNTGKNHYLKKHNWRYRLTHPFHKERWFVFFNLIIVISTVIISVIDFIYGTSGGQNGFSVQGWNYFMPFTIISNILMAIASAIALIKLIRHNYQARYLANKNTKVFDRRFTNFYYMASVSLNLTAVTVALFLAPFRFINGEDGLSMFLNDMFFFHFINPILASYSILYLFSGDRINQTSRLLCFIPPSFYSVVYVTHVLIIHDWSDFYNFTFGGNYALAVVSAVVNIAAIYTIATLFANVYNRRLAKEPLSKITLPIINLTKTVKDKLVCYNKHEENKNAF